MTNHYKHITINFRDLETLLYFLDAASENVEIRALPPDLCNFVSVSFND
jgi:hypothetical protein